MIEIAILKHRIKLSVIESVDQMLFNNIIIMDGLW